MSVDGGSVMPVADGNGNWLVLTSGGTLREYDPAFVFQRELSVDPIPFIDNVGSYAKGQTLFGRWYPDSFTLLRVGTTYMKQEIEFGQTLHYIAAVGNVLLFSADSTDPNLLQYVAYVVADNGSSSRLDHDATLVYMQNNFRDCSVRNGVIYYKGNPLAHRRVAQIDDDGNFYEARLVIIDGVDSLLIETGAEAYSASAFDSEGNFWAIGITNDAKQNLVFLYGGRDWGYQESPKKAVATANGLRIRLRATTDGFVLGKLSNGQAVTVLKTGPSATITGKTAPWYRIKTSDGLIGWVFGGFLQLAEK